MTTPEELAWNHAIENEDFELARQIEAERDTAQKEQPSVSNATEEQRAILGAAAYWGIDHGSLPRHEP
jgi:hypothetical protein